jgi:hypothetical protein
VNHRKLLSLLKRRLKDKQVLNLLWKFLKAGVMEGQLFVTTADGVPQGGCVSPLLANLYLNEFDPWAEAKWHRRSRAERQKIRVTGGGNYVMVRDADDFVVISNDSSQGVRHAKDEIKAFLEGELKLTLSAEKTCITPINDGFDFLGLHLQRVHSEGRWVVHLRPPANSMKRAKVKLKALTDHSQILYDEVTKLGQINQVVKGWCHYYRHTSLYRDLEAISRYAWHRYLRWLLKKHQGSRKHHLIKDKTRRIYNRERGVATTGERTLYPWLPSPRELKRSRYRQKGRQRFPHPYLGDEDIKDSTLPTGQKGPDESIYQTVRGLDGQRQFPKDWHERRLQVLQRDGVACTRCGTTNDLQVHHKRGLQSWKQQDLETLCRKCHLQAHGYKVRMTSDGEPDASKDARPGCAVRRVITFPVQPGSTRRRCLGYQLTCGRKANGTRACWE